MSYLAHHGVKGQRWGVRNGPPYPLDRFTKGTESEMNDIYSTLSKKEKTFLMDNDNPPKKFINKGEEKYLVESVMLKHKNVPVSSITIWNNEDFYTIAAMTRNDPKYRGKNYAYKTAKQALDKVAKKNTNDIPIYWDVWSENTPSIKTAEKLGLEFNEVTEKHDNGEWLQYKYSSKKRS